jgi:glutathione S-transferase
MPNKLFLYAHPVAQPSRAIMWILKTLGVDYELKLLAPRTPANYAPEFLNIFGLGTIPALRVDNEEGKTILAVSDFLAIADYVCSIAGEKGEELYPKDPIIRSKVLQMTLHGQITVRPCAAEVWRPLYLAFLNKTPCPYDKTHLQNFIKDFEGKVVDMSRAAGWTKAKFDGTRDEVIENPASVFLVPEAGNKPTIADFINYAETYQLEVLEVEGYKEILERRPAFKRWDQAMKSLPHWEFAHEAVIGYAKENLIPLMPK